MECPHCQVNFHPQMGNMWIGTNGNGKQGHLFWQICPRCKEFIVCLKESDTFYQDQKTLEDSDILTYKKSQK